MDNTEVVGKKTRKRSKSEALAAAESHLQLEQESAPDLNGEGTDAGIDKPKDLNMSHSFYEDNEPMDTTTLQEILEDNPKGRKRKASEVKEDESLQDKETKDLSGTESGNKSDSKDELSESSADSKDIKLPPKQTLGKGKRARIPNKRYGDILLSEKKSRSSLANGETQNLADTSPSKENIHSDNVSSSQENKDDNTDTLKTPAVASLKGSRTSQAGSPSTPASKKPKLAVDLSNPNYLKPFNYGWKRELVYRATSDNTSKRNGDIYYYTPSGKKVRSMREVSENLKNKELTLDDFTFFKEPIGIDDPEKEIIRDAKYKAVGPPKKSSPKTPKMASPKTTGPSSTPSLESTPTTPTNAKGAKGGGFKIRLSGRAKEKKAEKKTDANMDVANWSPPAKKSMSKWSGSRSPNVSAPAKRKSARASNLVNVDKTPENKFSDFFLQNVAYGYKSLLYIFQYLKVQDLLRAGCVCTMWKDLASHPILWKTVRMKNSQVHSFEGLANTLEKHGTVHLDLRKMLLPNGGDEIWPSFSQAIKKVESLRKIELCRCPAIVVEQLATSNPQLEVINAVTIKCENMSLSPFAALRNLQELRLKSTAGLSLTSDLTALKELTLLKHLSLTSVKDLNKLNIDVIADLRNLESLELGECTDFPKTFGPEILINLYKLEKLRLEKGQGNCYTFEILDAVKNMPKLEQLELVNFDIKAGFDKALGLCTNIKKLLIIPTYISQSATTNHMVLGGVLRLQSTLSHFVWGVTLELLRVTELFVDQCEEPEKKERKEKKSAGNGDSIPVLKPVPLLTENVNEIPPAHEPPQVEILPLPNLQKLLLQSLPTTRVKILKIPFHATWRQSITDTVN